MPIDTDFWDTLYFMYNISQAYISQPNCKCRLNYHWLMIYRKANLKTTLLMARKDQDCSTFMAQMSSTHVQSRCPLVHPHSTPMMCLCSAPPTVATCGTERSVSMPSLSKFNEIINFFWPAEHLSKVKQANCPIANKPKEISLLNIKHYVMVNKCNEIHIL